MYAGPTPLGKPKCESKSSTAEREDGRAPQAAIRVAGLIRDHHPGYIAWDQFERNQALIASNAHMKSRMEPKAGRGGERCFPGILRCRRCGRMIHAS